LEKLAKTFTPGKLGKYGKADLPVGRIASTVWTAFETARIFRLRKGVMLIFRELQYAPAP